MSRIVGLFLIVALALGFTASGTSQEKKAKGQLPAGWKNLGLSAEQKEKVYKIQGEYKPKITALEKQLLELREQEKAELLKVLTPEQKAKLIGETPKATK